MKKNIADKVATFFQMYHNYTYQKGELLIRAGESPNGIFYLTKGMVKKYTVSQNGEEAVANIFAPLSFFPMDWGINRTSNYYYYEAMTSVTTHKAPVEEVLHLLRREPDILFDLLSRVYRGIEGLEMKLILLMTGSAYQRLVLELLIACRRFGVKGKDNIVLSWTEKDLAAQTGMTRETVSREMKVLKDKKLISMGGGKMYISSEQRLLIEIGF